MATFSYKIRDEQGAMQRGVVQASDQKEAVFVVHKLGGFTIEVKEIHSKNKSEKKKVGKLSLKDRIVFTEQLAVMLKAGITLMQSLKGLEEEASNKTLRTVLGGVIKDVEGGLSFSEALRKYPKIFSNIYCQMIKSAEKTGNLAGILGKLTSQQQKEYDLRGKVKGALMYPAIISVLLLGVIIMVLTFILPKLTGLFTDSGVELPTSTKILIGLSDFFVNQWYVVVFVIVGVPFAFKLITRNPKGLYAWDNFKIKIPVLGSFLVKSYIARFTQSFASLSEAGVPVLEIFHTLEGIIGNSVYEAEIKKIAADVENGSKVSTAIRKSKYFPGMVGQLVSVGEQSGDLAGIFTVLGDFFEKEVDGMAKNLSTLLEPIIMIVMGVAVGFVLISVLQPIFNLSNSI